MLVLHIHIHLKMCALPMRRLIARFHPSASVCVCVFAHVLLFASIRLKCAPFGLPSCSFKVSFSPHSMQTATFLLRLTSIWLRCSFFSKENEPHTDLLFEVMFQLDFSNVLKSNSCCCSLEMLSTRKNVSK